MPFDGNPQDYTRVAPVYDRDNPPTRMSEAIRMAVADVEAQERAGVEYDYENCARCTGGAVFRRMGARLDGEHTETEQFGPVWHAVFWFLSEISAGVIYDLISAATPMAYAHRAGFSVPRCSVRVDVTPYSHDPVAFKRDMLALADRLEAEGS